MSFNSWPLPHSSSPHTLYSDDMTDEGKSTVDKPLQTRANLGSVRCACGTASRDGYSLKIDWVHGIHTQLGRTGVIREDETRASYRTFRLIKLLVSGTRYKRISAGLGPLAEAHSAVHENMQTTQHQERQVVYDP